MSSKGPIFRIFNPAGKSKEDTAEKRRAQVRRAQQVYRERRTRYVKALEGNLAVSRRRENQDQLEKKQLHGDIQTLLRLLQQHDISIPYSILSHGGVSLSNPQAISPVSQDSSYQGGHPEWPQTAWSLTPPQSEISSPRVCDIDPITLGMKFVLKIEEPCLGHVHGDPSKPEEPSGHALTVTSQVLCLSSSAAPKRSSLIDTHSAPEDIMKRLLTLAPEVAGDGEVTPIQAWNEIRRKPVLGSLDVQCVMNLAEKLRDAAKCHGFGAVVDSQVFQTVVHGALASRITF